MNLQQIKYVVTISEQGSFSKASQILYITQPTLSNEVKKLEKELGITIFSRNKHGAQVTDAGREFLEYARGIIEQFQCVENKYCSMEKEQEIVFSVASQHIATAAEAFMDVVADKSSNHYRMKLHEGRTKDVLKLVADNICQIGVLSKNPENRVLDFEISKNELEYFPVISMFPHVYLYKKHPLAGKKQVTREDLKDYPFLVYDQGFDSLRNFSEEAAVEQQIPRTIVVTDRGMQISMSVYLNAYTIGSGLLGSRTSLRDMVAIPLKDEKNSSLEIGWIKRRNQEITPVMREYIARLSQLCAEQDSLQPNISPVQYISAV